jgi:peptide deformylase
MVLPILSYGHPILRQKCDEIASDYALAGLINDMWETLYGAEGCGLAAPQIGKPIQLFLVDSKLIFNQMNPESRLVYFEDNNGIREVFINATVTASSERQWISDEACLSIPGLQYSTERPWSITIEYLDEFFKRHKQTFSGITARMILHEYEHTRGVLYIDHLKSSRHRRLNSKLEKIRKGLVKSTYPMQFPGK